MKELAELEIIENKSDLSKAVEILAGPPCYGGALVEFTNTTLKNIFNNMEID